MLIIGLGNPGKKYRETRHNIGFQIIDKFRKKNNFPEFKLSQKLNSLISEGIFGKEKTILGKPQTFMNNSGIAVKKLVSGFKFRVSSLIVIHDDIDLPLGEIRIIKNRGAAGHKGVESIIKEIGTKNFVRFRIGISPKQYHRLVCGTERFVLQKFNKEEGEIAKDIIKKTIKALEVLITQGLEKAMNEYNK